MRCMCRCDVELLSFQVHSIPAPFTQPCCGRKFTCTPNTTAVISCDSTAIPVGQRGFTVPEKRMNQSMLWWLVDFSHTKIVLCLKYIPHEMKHEWGWDCFPAPKWISNLFLLPADFVSFCRVSCGERSGCEQEGARCASAALWRVTKNVQTAVNGRTGGDLPAGGWSGLPALSGFQCCSQQLFYFALPSAELSTRTVGQPSFDDCRAN